VQYRKLTLLKKNAKAGSCTAMLATTVGSRVKGKGVDSCITCTDLAGIQQEVLSNHFTLIYENLSDNNENSIIRGCIAQTLNKSCVLKYLFSTPKPAR
jgi:hypothetical protein